MAEIDTSIAVLVNSIGLGDPASWINQLLIEAVIDSHEPNDYVKLAQEAAKNHATTVDRMWQRLNKVRKDIPAPRPLQEYTGRYRSPKQDFLIDVKVRDTAYGDVELELLVQGLESQSWKLNHWEDDTFLTLTTFNDWAKRAMFTLGNENFFRFRFQADETDHVTRLYWKLDANVSADDQFFIKEGTCYDFVIQNSVLKSVWVIARFYVAKWFRV